MMNSISFGFLFLLFIQVIHRSTSSVTLEMKFIEFLNPGGRGMDGNHCDLFGGGDCDPSFIICINTVHERTDSAIPDKCLWRTDTRGTIQEANDVDFSQTAGPLRRPVTVALRDWSGRVYLWMDVNDKDIWGATEQIDKLRYTFVAKPNSTRDSAIGHSRKISGTRTTTNATELYVIFHLYCSENYFGPDCDVYCNADAEPDSHFVCDQKNGSKICKEGWEDPENNCNSSVVLCRDCSNGGRCGPDGSCICPTGFTGEYCDIATKFCNANPCLNNGSCVEDEDGYRCVCHSGFAGPQCQGLNCNGTNRCQNGGRCYVNDKGINKCDCQEAFTGRFCQFAKCDLLPCFQGSCVNGACQCRRGYIGSACKIDLCYVTTCLNGANCRRGHCDCSPGYTGRHCEIEMDPCKHISCRNGGTCIKQSGLRARCVCRFPYYGLYCDDREASQWDVVEGADIPTIVPKLETNDSISVDDTERSTMSDGLPSSMPLNSEVKEDGISPAVIAGVCISIIALVAATVAAVYFIKRRRCSRCVSMTTAPSIDNPLFKNSNDTVPIEKAEVPPAVAEDISKV